MFRQSLVSRVIAIACLKQLEYKVELSGGLFVIHEDENLVFRTEFFDMFNHAQFNNPSGVDISKTTFGQITSASVNPRLIQFALKYVF